MKRSLATAFLAMHMAAAGAADGTCSRWSEPAKVGDLDVKVINEASGIAISRNGQRLYHNNDGSFPLFHVTDLQGGATQSVKLAGFTPQDIEDMSLGPCGNSTCLYVADIGDNAVRRESVQIALVREQRTFGAEVTPDKVLTVRYPDGPHDAEAIAVHPQTGDLFLATKAGIGKQQNPALLFRLAAAQIAAGGEQTFALAGQIPVIDLSEPLGNNPRRIVTAMDIAPDGNRFVLLTYDAFIEIAADLKNPLPSEWINGKTHRAFPIATLIQAEAITYDRDGLSILYSTESVRGSPAPLTKQLCQD